MSKNLNQYNLWALTKLRLECTLLLLDAIFEISNTIALLLKLNVLLLQITYFTIKHVRLLRQLFELLRAPVSFRDSNKPCRRHTSDFFA
jgi:hypothetical protein